MAGRRAQPPRVVAAASIAPTGDAEVDRVLKQVEQALQDLQTKVINLEARVAALE